MRVPAKIDLVSAERVGEQLCSAFTLGAAVVIADLTSTLFCDSAGIRQFVLAHNYASANVLSCALWYRSGTFFVF